MRMKSTSCLISVSRIGFGWNSATSVGGAAISLHEVREARAVVDPRCDCSFQVLLDQRAVVAVVERLGLELQPLAHEVEQRRERRYRRRHVVALYTRDRRLGRA